MADDDNNWKPLTVAASKALSPDCEKQKSAFEKAQYLQAARRLLGCYRTGEANDPEVYIFGVVRVFSGYPIEVAYGIADPLSGLPSKIKWLPTIVEVKEACDAELRRLRWVSEWNEGVAAQLAERQRIEDVRKQAKETWEETKADLERRGFQFSHKKRDNLTADKVMHTYGVSKEQWDAIPNLPPDHEVKARKG